MNQKIGFWPLLAIVINAQLGASIFLIPSKLAIFKAYGLVGWCIGGIGAILLALVFAFLCMETNQPGGPHIYARLCLGDKFGFFVTWLYWCGAWVCNPILISTSVFYLETVIGQISIYNKFILEVSILLSLTVINMKGIKLAGYIEGGMVIIKLLPLILIPILAISNINIDNFTNNELNDMTITDAICKSSIAAFWGFVGLEEGGSAADSVCNAKKSVPLAIVLGTSIVAIISFINTFAIFGILPFDILEKTGAPFAVVLSKLLGGNYNKAIGLLTFIMCYGSLNAWVLFSGKLAQTAANANMFPKIFGKSSSTGAPIFALSIAAIGTMCILAILEFSKYKDTLSSFLDMSVIMYIVLYLLAIICYFALILKKKSFNVSRLVIAILAFAFCFLMLIWSNIYDFSAVAIVLIIAIPVYQYWRKSGR